MTKRFDPGVTRGAADLEQLWRRLPVGVLQYRMTALPDGLGLSQLSDTLRKQAWRAHCDLAPKTMCADAGRACPLAGTGRCRADQLYPMYLGGGAPQWRMATLFMQWLPHAGCLRLVALGETACAELRWAGSVLCEQHGLPPYTISNERTFADVLLPASLNWQLDFVTPWLVAKNRRERAPSREDVAHELGKSMRSRGQKFTALCATETIWQRLGGHLVHYIADALFPFALEVGQVQIEHKTLALASYGNGGRFRISTWNGRATLRAEKSVLPWLSLLSICGGGENADKGFGVVELRPLQ